MTSRFANLMSPGRIGALEIRNRILMCPMGDCLANADGSVSERQLSYYEARARGGAGMLLVGSVSVAYPSGSYGAMQTALSNDAFVPGLQRLTSRVHDHGARVAAQLVHDGQRSLLDIAHGRAVLCASPPARVATDRLSRMVTADEIAAMTAPFTQPTSKFAARVATEADLRWVIATFADAAARAARAGFDGVEVHAGHGYLIDDFISPASNTRDDRWGGSVENRARLLCDVVRATRDRVGAEFPIWFRVNALERFREGGETFSDALRVIDLAVDTGADAVHVSAFADAGVAVGITRSHTPHEPNALVGFAAEVKQRVRVPVITFGRIEPDDAERVIADGRADFVAMGRKLLADPDLPAKLRDGRVDDIRPCIYQYRCIGNIFLGTSVACVANPATGRGDHADECVATSDPRRVLVVGGGPAGLEAARRLAAVGHSVELWEAGTRLGGRLASAARCDAPLDRFLGWLLRAVDDADVVVELGTMVTAQLIAAADFDEVVLATGQRWDAPPIPGAELPFVLTIDALTVWLANDSAAQDSLGASIVVAGGGKVGLSLADLAARRGHTVTVLESTAVFGSELGLPGRFELVAGLEARGVDLRPECVVESFESGAVVVRAGGEPARVAADAVIVATPTGPDRGIASELDTAGIAYREIGDCRRFGLLEGALLDASELAEALSV